MRFPRAPRFWIPLTVYRSFPQNDIDQRIRKRHAYTRLLASSGDASSVGEQESSAPRHLAFSPVSARKKKSIVKEGANRFRSEDEERDFWAENDVVDYFDWENSIDGSFPALKPSTQTISLRLPQPLLAELKTMANERDVPYQSLLKIFLAERVARERSKTRS